MLGYIRPLKDELKIAEYNTYKSVYCSLCKKLGKVYGFPARLILSYDYTFFAMLGIALKNECPGYKNGRCVVNPLKKCGFCTSHDEIFDLTAAVSVILFYYKIIDNIADSNYLTKLKYYLFLPFAGSWRKKAAKIFPEIDLNANSMMSHQFEIEKQNGSVDECAHPTAEFVSFIAQKLSDNQEERSILKTFGYHLGRWIYLMDAQDDMVKDLKKGCFNPILKKFNCTEINMELLKKMKEYTNGILNMSISEVIFCYKQLNILHYNGILENILNLGTQNLQIKVFEIKEK